MTIINAAKKMFKGRFSLLFSIISLYIILSFIIRFTFLIWSLSDINLNFLYIIKAFGTGFLYDLTIATLFVGIYTVYLLLAPQRIIGSIFDKFFTYFYITLILIIIYFSLVAEIPFWEEFGVRFNFIAVDYLIYTYEVVENINQSYPIPLIVISLIAVIGGTFYLLKKQNVFKYTFSDKMTFAKRSLLAIPILVIMTVLGITMKNKTADFTNNLVINELGKNVNTTWWT